MISMCLSISIVSRNSYSSFSIHETFQLYNSRYTFILTFIYFTELKLSLSQRMFGQPLVDELVNILHAHKEAVSDPNKSNKKALVISLHGWPGVGKNYAATMIAEALYAKGMHSKYVKLYMGKKDFDCSNLQQKKVSINL